jgi:hypothetical protein
MILRYLTTLGNIQDINGVKKSTESKPISIGKLKFRAVRSEADAPPKR